mgnify:CR=1 FL=1
MSSLSSKPKLGEKLTKMSREAEERDAKRRAEKLGYTYIDLKTAPIQVSAVSILSKEEAHEAKCAILAEKRDKLIVVAYDPSLPNTKKTIDQLLKKAKKIDILIGSMSGIERVWSFYDLAGKKLGDITGKVEIDNDRLIKLQESISSLEATRITIDSALKSQVATGQVLEIVLAAALSLKASDIHLEPEQEGVKFRLRIDGLLHEIYSGFPQSEYFLVLSRIKLLASMKLNIHNAAQDGRFSVKMGKKTIEIRASALPSEYGETVVLRVLDPDTILLSLKDLGLNDEDLKIIEVELQRPNGMILNTGPTGSGKTTTLYAFLVHVNKPEDKMITIEDPIEYKLPGVEQTQVNPEAGYTFASGLRSIVRQDPDVILIGEIRDYETADIALNAALTGHLVFSTLHTNDSFGAIPRLVDLGAKPAIMGPAINLIIAQRLVRRLCDKCKKPQTEATEKFKPKISTFLQSLPSTVPQDKYKNIILYQPVGCSACNGIGYKGRIAIMEILKVTDLVSQLISKEVTDVDIKTATKSLGIVTIQQAGILRALLGITTLDEVERITGPLNW